MTSDPGLSPDKVAELEQKLADAAAEVAKVRAQLAEATAAGAGAAPATPVPPVPAVPYGAGQTLLSAEDLQALIGTQVQTQLSPQAVDQLQKVMSRFGLDQVLGPALGLPVAPHNPPSPTSVAMLSEPPRPVPMAYRLATFDWSWWEVFTLIMVGIAPIALWILVPESWLVGVLVTAAGVVLFRGRRYVRRTGLLRWGKVATVTATALVDRGTYYSGTTYNNMRLRSARGWTTTTQWYSGPANTTDITYALDGTTSTLRLRGLPYVDGVVLADSREPARAMCVSQFPYDLTPQPDGRWPGVLSVWTWLGVFLTLVIEVFVVTLAVLAVVDAVA